MVDRSLETNQLEHILRAIELDNLTATKKAEMILRAENSGKKFEEKGKKHFIPGQLF